MGICYDDEFYDLENARHYGVRAFCDACDEPIGIADAGVMQILTDGRLLFAHKGVCHDFVEQRLAEGQDCGWLDLTDLLRHLARNHSDGDALRLDVTVARSRDNGTHPDFALLTPSQRLERWEKIRETQGLPATAGPADYIR